MSPSVCVLGAAGDTANLGVSALLESILHGVDRVEPRARSTVFDNGFGHRSGHLRIGERSVDYDRRGLRLSRRLHRPESLYNMALAARLPIIPNGGVQTLRAAQVALDISGGDSFTDLYGKARFEAMVRQKALVLDVDTPLVLLPQTYGPFEDRESWRAASALVRKADAAWARDPDSFDVLVELLGGDVDSERHRSGVDVAFALPATRPDQLDATTNKWLEEEDVPVLGLNVSGLLYNVGSASKEQFGFAQEYSVVIRELVRQILSEFDGRLLLIPHVVAPAGEAESDGTACEAIVRDLRGEDADVVHVVSGITEAQHAKWVIGECTAFCGTRMHSTIAALSTMTPVAALAYSPKTRGVFETCRQQSRVADLRTSTAEQIGELVLRLWRERSAVRDELASTIPSVIARASEPFQALPSYWAERE